MDGSGARRSGEGAPGMLVGIHQPHYLPWLRYFEKIARSDAFIVLDTVQFSKNGWQNRNKIKTARGVGLLTVPVHANLHDPIARIAVRRDGKWRRKHWQSIRQSYAKAPYFEAHAAFFETVYAQDWALLADLNRHLLDYFLAALGIDTPVAYASELDVPGTATERLANLVKAVGGDTYYSGAFALDEYLDADLLAREGIGLELQDWTAPVYPQLHGPFVADLSIIDLIMNCGPDSLAIILGGNA
ncbi:MAG: WbqC family protein [Candidatus Hydrogenedentes bacterium]|nr:WbqC family protein [Candidatus Hydrogenedentota bacterium]